MDSCDSTGRSIICGGRGMYTCDHGICMHCIHVYEYDGAACHVLITGNSSN